MSDIPNQDKVEPSSVSRSWLWGAWIGVVPLAALLYLLPLSFPGERWLLLLCLALVWAGVIASFWTNRGLRIAAFAVALLEFFPIRSGLTRMGLLLGMAGLLVAVLLLYRKRKEVVFGLLAAILAIGGFLLLPGRAVDAESLRAEYVRSLQGYRGAVYVWGGENRIGIDCSGIVRCGWIDANLRCGLRTAKKLPPRVKPCTC